VSTPKPVWNPDVPQTIDFMAGWQDVPETSVADNAFKAQWELFIRHVVEGSPFPWDLGAGAKGVQLVEAGLKSWQERRWVDVGPLQD
jgi:predicted dehydrogenase